MRRSILANRIRTPDGTLLESRNMLLTKHKDANGFVYAVSGSWGEIFRDCLPDAPAYEECSLFSDDPHVVLRHDVLWGTYGKGGDDPYKLISVADMTDEHIAAILKTQQQIVPAFKRLLKEEQKFRKENSGT